MFICVNNLSKVISNPRAIRKNLSGLQTAYYQKFSSHVQDQSSCYETEKKDFTIERTAIVTKNFPKPRSFGIKTNKTVDYDYAKERRLIIERRGIDSYLSTCIMVGHINRAHNFLTTNRECKRGSLLTFNHYNIVIRGWSTLGNITKIDQLLSFAKADGFQPDITTYTSYLLALSKTDYKISQVEWVLNNMEEAQIDINDIYRSVYLYGSERYRITNMVREVKRDFNPLFYEDIPCDNELLSDMKNMPTYHYNYAKGLDLSSMFEFVKQQRRIENQNSVRIESIANRLRKPSKTKNYQTLWDKYVENWRKLYNASLDESFRIIKNQSDNEPSLVHLYPYLCALEREVLIDLMIDQVENCAHNHSYSVSSRTLHFELGSKIMTKFFRILSRDNGTAEEKANLYKDYLRTYLTQPSFMGKINSREFFLRKARENKYYAIYEDRLAQIQCWPVHILVSLGRFLQGIILKETKFDTLHVKHPSSQVRKNHLVHVFYTAYFQVGKGMQIKEELRSHPDFGTLYNYAMGHQIKLSYNYLPMLCPPLPWLTPRFGGYLTTVTEMVRYPFSTFDDQYPGLSVEKMPSLSSVFDSLNALSLCPWKINKTMLDIIIKLFKKGGDESLSIPLHDSKFEDISAPNKKMSKADKVLHLRQVRSLTQKRQEMFGLWIECLYRLSIANHFRDRIFWQPHNIDFRGRTYPIPPHFNHLGADMARSLMLFAKGEPLGQDGLDWLKLHCINLTGTMKQYTIEERIANANLMLPEILDSADNVWNGRKWWTKHDNPWQVLATCKEIANAIRSDNPAEYICHLPIHQDGSCNGLQHYAALGRDLSGAKAVNVFPSSTPQDVYSRILEVVENKRMIEARKGVEMAKLLEGYIKRKVIKQTVMTTVYGVTRFGARMQIEKQLKALNFDETQTWKASIYLTRLTFDSIGDVFAHSTKIQNWLTSCARIVTSKCKQPVSWITPLGFPVVQPYSNPGSTFVGKKKNSGLGLIHGVSSFDDALSKPSSVQQKNAFPANYIHSLDSAHMMLTSLYCQKYGITFVSVHDCYWTHTSTASLMSKVCRQQFLALHSQPLLNDLLEQFKEYIAASNHGDKRDMFQDVPKKGSLDLRQVLESRYFFS